MKFAKTILIATILFAGLWALPANAQSCQPLLDDLINHASASSNNYVDFKMTGNRGGSDWVQYTTGTLKYSPGRFVNPFWFPPTFSGEAEQSFSDRIWYEPPAPGCTGFCSTPAHPFNPHAKDKLRVSFKISPLATGGNYGDLTYTLLSWGNASATVTPQCQGKYMYAFLNDQMLTITFKKGTTPIIH